MIGNYINNGLKEIFQALGFFKKPGKLTDITDKIYVVFIFYQNNTEIMDMPRNNRRTTKFPLLV